MRWIVVLVAVAGCGGGGTAADDVGDDDGGAWTESVALPEALSDPAVSAVVDGDDCTIYAFDDHAYRWREGDAAWEPLVPAPAGTGRGGVGLALDGDAWVIGGVDGATGGFQQAARYDAETGGWLGPGLPERLSYLGAAVWRDRWIVTVGGRDGYATAAVHVYDLETDTWIDGTAFPPATVMDHAIAIIDDTLILVDGGSTDAGRDLTNEVWFGALSPDDPGTIAWTSMGPHPGVERYGTATYVDGDEAVFLGGGRYPDVLGEELRIALDGSATIGDAPAVIRGGAAACPDAVYLVGGEGDPGTGTRVWRQAR